MMEFLKQYLSRSEEIIGERTPDEEKYDKEVIRWLHKGKPIKKAIAKANQKFPGEALTVTDENLADVQAHYEYLAEHEGIIQKLSKLK
jgi:hypothetical protein